MTELEFSGLRSIHHLDFNPKNTQAKTKIRLNFNIFSKFFLLASDSKSSIKAPKVT
jgi:hypothetical protein